jgi:hypothetical protein
MNRFYQWLESRRLLSDYALRFDGVNDFATSPVRPITTWISGPTPPLR